MAIDHEFQILVVGGGIGGLAAARFLTAAGFDPVVVESDDSLDGEGGPVEVWPDAMSVLSWLDVADTVREAGSAVRSWALRDVDGTAVRRLETDGSTGFVAVAYGLVREALLDGLPADTVRTDTTVRSLDDDGQHVPVEFDNGVTESFDAVIGADGVYSTTRNAIGGPDPEPCGTTSIAFPLSSSVGFDGATEQWTSDGRVLRVVPVGDRPWGVSTVPSGSSDRSPAPRETVLRGVAGTDWLPREALPDAPDRFLQLDDVRVESGPRTGNRVALLGDAAAARHRLASGGVSLALEDAVEVVGALTGGEGPIPERLSVYSSRRHPRTDRRDGSDDVVPPLASVASRVPDRIRGAAGIRSARLRSGFSGTPPTPPV